MTCSISGKVVTGTFSGTGDGTHGFTVSAPAGSLIQIAWVDSSENSVGTLTPPSIPTDARSGLYTRNHASGDPSWTWGVALETWRHDGRASYDFEVAGDLTGTLTVAGQYVIIPSTALDTSRSEWDGDVPGMLGRRWIIEGFGGNYSDWNVLLPSTPIVDGTVGWEFGDTYLSDTLIDVRQFVAEPVSAGAPPTFGAVVDTISGASLSGSGPFYYDGTFRTQPNSSNTPWYSVGGYYAFSCGRIPPLRQNQRDDIRQGQRTSRQLTVRQVGYL